MESYDIPENDDDPECIEMAFHTCNISCKHLDVFDDGNGYRVFYVKMVDSAGETAVSQLSMGERISTHICEVYGEFSPFFQNVNFNLCGTCKYNSEFIATMNVMFSDS